MMYERPLFKPDEFEGGRRGEGLNMSIEEFKKIRDKRVQEWSSTEKLSSEKLEIQENLKRNYQWEDFKHHHLALVAKVLQVEINKRTSKAQEKWICIKPDEQYPETKMHTIPLKHNRRIWLENLQEIGGWHFNLLIFRDEGLEN